MPTGQRQRHDGGHRDRGHANRRSPASVIGGRPISRANGSASTAYCFTARNNPARPGRRAGAGRAPHRRRQEQHHERLGPALLEHEQVPRGEQVQPRRSPRAARAAQATERGRQRHRAELRVPDVAAPLAQHGEEGAQRRIHEPEHEPAVDDQPRPVVDPGRVRVGEGDRVRVDPGQQRGDRVALEHEDVDHRRRRRLGPDRPHPQRQVRREQGEDAECRTTPRPAAIAHAAPTATTAAAGTTAASPARRRTAGPVTRCSIVPQLPRPARPPGRRQRPAEHGLDRAMGRQHDGSSTAATATVSQTNATGRRRRPRPAPPHPPRRRPR